MERYKKLMEKCGIKTYTVISAKKESVELFFIKKKLDMRRMTDVSEVSFAIYKDMEAGGKKFRGRADIVTNESMSDDEIIEKIKSADYAAEFVKNPFFELPDKEMSGEVVQESDLFGKELSKIADSFVKTVYEADCDESAFINSFELFVSETHAKVITSKGTDVSFVKRNVKGEFVAQCTEPQDVETYQDFEFDSMALSDMKALVERTLSMTRDRAKATKMPKAGTYDVILSDKYVPEIISFYMSRANAAYIFQGYSKLKVGDNVQGEKITGEELSITLGVDEPFNAEGIRMVERPLLDKGVLKTIHGSSRFCYYLGVKQIGTYSKAIIPAGKTSFEKMKDRPCLHIVNFSDFQMDALDGHYAGEIRLAYLYDGKGNVEIVTGGSINGSIFEAQKDMLLSTETQNLANYSGPRAMLLKGVSVAGE